MVLQREMRVPIWGWADAGEPINVLIGGHYSETVADNNGRWKLYLGPLDSGGPFEMTVIGKNKISIKNVYVGEVWVCSGQSNMAFEVQNSLNPEREINTANYPLIRHFQVSHTKANTSLEDIEPSPLNKNPTLDRWQVCSPSTVSDFTGVGYFFGRELFKDLNVPIGLINASWGGTTAEAWTPVDVLENNPKLEEILQDWPNYNNDENWLKLEYETFVAELAIARKEGNEVPIYFNEPSVLYNGIIGSFIPYGIKGVIWYQGESNAYRASQYKELFPAMIRGWREKWQQGNFPFIFAQLANYDFEPQVFPELREAQLNALSVPETAMVVTMDIGNPKDIHPKNKQEVGRRLSLAARKLSYYENIEYSGPLYKSMYISEGKCLLDFNNTGDGMVAKARKTLDGFEIAGVDQIFHKAKAVITGKKVLVWNDDVTKPVAVRYAWHNNPEKSNLYNKIGEKENLPASPFRTDNWPIIANKRKL
tara:strand:+ start:6789 stop:8225 length:1437 start_codon:yes stop_codon:yes gene_type:complete